MKGKIHKILGVGITLVIALALVLGFVAPAAASPAETINEWYKFEYPVPGEDGGWLYDPTIWRIGEITEAIDNTLYVHVQRILDADPDTGGLQPFTFEIPDVPADPYTGTLTITEFYDDVPSATGTGIITAEIAGTWDGPETDFVAWCDVGDGAFDGSVCLSGTLTATSMTFEGSIENIGSWLPEGTWDVTDGDFEVCPGGFGVFSGWLELWDGYDTWDIYFDYGVTNIGSFVFKSTDGARSWEDTGFPGGWVVDMAASSVDADTLYVADGHYVYKTDDAGDTWSYVSKDSLEEQLAGYCGVPACCYLDEGCLPSCGYYPFTCPITSIDVAYDDDDNPYVYIGTRKHCSGVDINGDGDFDYFPGDVYWIGEASYPSSWSSLGLSCYGGGGYDALAVGCAPDWADSHETYAVVTNGDETHVTVTTGGPCDWPEFTELLLNCTTSFGSAYASRIAFPDDWEDTGTLFVGVVDCDYCDPSIGEPPHLGGAGGDVYMAFQDDCIDMNVLGISAACVGLKPVDIISLDIEGDTDEASLIAGSFCCNEVYCSTDGGWNWDASDKDPTGGGLLGDGPTLTYAIWYEDTALAVTSGCECAVSMCCGEDYPCEFWNQISLISTDIDCVRDIDHSPGYVCGDSETMFMLTNWDAPEGCCFPCQDDACYSETQSLWRHDGTYWERVYSSTIAGADVHDGTPDNMVFKRVHVSPDFNETNAVFLVNPWFEIWRTTDAGCSWDKMTFPCVPRGEISAEVVIDEDTVIVGGRGPNRGYVYKTERHGARPWYEYELPVGATDAKSFALEPGYEDPGSVLLGDEANHVFISEDGGETWELVGAGTTTGCEAILTGHDTFVVFDPDYATNNTIYAAAGTVVARCIIDPEEDMADQEWEVICGNLVNAWGIQAAGDTALYVTDRDEAVDDKGPKITDDTVECVDGNYLDLISDYGGVIRSLNPLEEEATDVIFERIAKGLTLKVDGDSVEGSKLMYLWLTCDTSEDGCAENVLWALDKAYCETIWVYEDTLAAPVTLSMPLDGQKLGTTDSATLSWNALCGADCYEVSLWKYCAECPDEKMVVTLEMDCAPGPCCMVCGPAAAEDLCACPAGKCPCTSDTCIVVSKDTTGTALEPGTEYFWQVRVCMCQPFLSKWSEVRTFSTALSAIPFVELCSPECGGSDIILTPNFSWEPVEGATGYDIEIATTETFTAGVIRGSSTVNAWVLTEPLEYATTYYWRVRAEKDGVYSAWTVCMFTTMAKPVEPPPPVEITPAPPAPTITIPPAEMITPNWIYAIIGIGAALCIVVIVLIVRTRRPPA